MCKCFRNWEKIIELKHLFYFPEDKVLQSTRDYHNFLFVLKYATNADFLVLRKVKGYVMTKVMLVGRKEVNGGGFK